MGEPILYFLTANLCRQSDVYLKKNNYKNCKNETADENKQNRDEDTRSRNEHNSYENGHRLKKSFNFF